MSEMPPRPLSPHLQIWRWHITMLGSIMHRVTGIGSTAGVVVVTAWLVCLGLGAVGHREAYDTFVMIGKTPLGLLIWFLISLAGFVHLMGGIRHWIWDVGAGLQPKTADALAFWTMTIGVLLTIAFWVLLFASKKVSL